MPADDDPLRGRADPRMAIVWTLKGLPFAIFAAIFIVVSLSVSGVIVSQPSPGDPGFAEGPRIRWGLGVALAVVFSAVVAIGALVYARNYRWEVGADEVRVRRGLVSRHRARVPYSRVQNVNVAQSALMRPLGVWSVELETAGSAGPKARPEGVLAGVGDPERWEAAVWERVEGAGGEGV